MKRIQIKQARRTYDMGSEHTARQVVEDLLHLYPNHPKTHHLEGRMYDRGFGAISAQHFLNSVCKHAAEIDTENIIVSEIKPKRKTLAF